jgi:hypothetical protein
MIKQTVLKFQGALGYLGFSKKDEEKEEDSGNSSHSNSSDDPDEDRKNTYTTTAMLSPKNQAISEIYVSRLNSKQITAEIKEYLSRTEGLKHFCRVFDSKTIVSKQDISSRVDTKISRPDVALLAMDA